MSRLRGSHRFGVWNTTLSIAFGLMLVAVVFIAPRSRVDSHRSVGRRRASQARRFCRAFGGGILFATVARIRQLSSATLLNPARQSVPAPFDSVVGTFRGYRPGRRPAIAVGSFGEHLTMRRARQVHRHQRTRSRRDTGSVTTCLKSALTVKALGNQLKLKHSIGRTNAGAAEIQRRDNFDATRSPGCCAWLASASRYPPASASVGRPST
jgi:hypothetical protein